MSPSIFDAPSALPVPNVHAQIFPVILCFDPPFLFFHTSRQTFACNCVLPIAYLRSFAYLQSSLVNLAKLTIGKVGKELRTFSRPSSSR
jgi:hypothetical protein